jgi:predicted outer membrane protein
MRLFPILLLSAAAGTSFAAITSQQQSPQSQQSSPTQKAAPQSQPAQTRAEPAQASNKHDDAFLATWVLTANNNEVTLSQIAQQKAQNEEVKQFAQKMVTDHQQAATKLQPFTSGPGLGSHPAGGLGEEHSNPGSISGTSGQTGSAAGQQPARPVEAGLGRMGMDLAGNLDHIGLITELGRQCLETGRKELEQKQGAEFDRCYMGMAIGMHTGMNDMLTVFQNHASSELRTALADAQRTVQMHLEQAKQIAKRLESASPSSSTPTSQPGSR